MEHDKKSLKEKKLDQIYEKYKENLTSIEDLTAGDDPNLLFFLWVKLFGFMLDDNPDKTISEKGLKVRKYAYLLIKKLGPAFLKVPQVIEDKNELLGYKKYEDGKKIILPKEPVIWTPNHSFLDDALGSVTVAYRNAYFLFGSLPHFYNNIDALAVWLNGAVMTNRKVKNSRLASVDKATKVLKNGTDLIWYPEGVWNKSPNKLLLDFWPGIYKMAVDNGVCVVPMIHYVKDKSELDKNCLIHTVVDEPIDFSTMSEKQALEYLREVMSTWYYLMMEKYGKSTREESLNGHNDSLSAWESELEKRIAGAGAYDLSIETSYEYQRKENILPEDVWENIANLEITKENASHVLSARKMVMEYKKNNFQKRF